MTLKGSNDETGITLNDPTAVNNIVNALKTGVALSVTAGGNTWNVGFCVTGDSLELNANAANVCDCDTAYVVRPCIGNLDGGNPNWGGINGPTCNTESQRMDVIFA